MAQWHLDEIENALHQAGWRITERTSVDQEDLVLGTWAIERSKKLMIYFDGLFDGMGYMIKNPSIEKAYACDVYDHNVGLYFYKKGQNWKDALRIFIEALDAI